MVLGPMVLGPTVLASPRRRRIGFAVAFAIVLSLGVAQAADPDEEYRVKDAEALVAKIESQHAAKDRAALKVTYKQAIALHNNLRTKAAKTKLQKAIGGVLKDKELVVVLRLEAVDALGELYDESGAYKQLKKFMPKDKDETADQIEMRVLRAVDKLAPDTAVKDLFNLAKKGKDMNAAVAAVRALGSYGYSKQRVKILKQLVEFMSSLAPGAVRGGSNRGIGGAARARYQSLSGPLITALNKLTGQSFETAEAWHTAYKANKSKLSKLFKTER